MTRAVTVHDRCARLRKSAHLGAVPLLLALLFSAASARANDQHEGDSPFRLTADGKPELWFERQVTVVIDRGVADVAPDAPGAVARGFGAWLGSGARVPALAFELSSDRLHAARDGRHTVTVGEVTPGRERDLAQTISYVDAASGEIVEADIVLNESFDFSLLDEVAAKNDEAESCSKGGGHAPAGAACGYDLQNLLSHESGHFFGLAENYDDPRATMYACSARCETHKRDLEPEDAASLAALYEDGPSDAPVAAGCSASGRDGGSAHCSALGSALSLVMGAGFRRRRKAPR